jgi:hypothetical protein
MADKKATVVLLLHEGSTAPLEEGDPSARAELLAEFTACRVSSDIPLFEEQGGLHLEQEEDDAVALL